MKFGYRAEVLAEMCYYVQLFSFLLLLLLEWGELFSREPTIFFLTFRFQEVFMWICKIIAYVAAAVFCTI